MIWFNELKQKEMKTRGATGHSDNFNEGLLKTTVETGTLLSTCGPGG